MASGASGSSRPRLPGAPGPAAPSGGARPVVREAVVEDAVAVVDLVESAYRGAPSREGWTTEADLLGGQRTDAEAVASLIRTPGGSVLLAEADGSLAGCCHLALRPSGPAYLGLLAVRPRLQGRGIGRLLVSAAEQRAGAAASAAIEMTVIAARQELIVWYGRLGYLPTGERRPFPYGDSRFGVPLRDDLEFVVLEKPLA